MRAQLLMLSNVCFYDNETSYWIKIGSLAYDMRKSDLHNNSQSAVTCINMLHNKLSSKVQIKLEDHLQVCVDRGELQSPVTSQLIVTQILYKKSQQIALQ